MLKLGKRNTKSHKIVSSLQCGWYIEGHHFYGFTNSDDSNLCHFDLGWAEVLEVDSRIKVDPGKSVKNNKLSSLVHSATWRLKFQTSIINTSLSFYCQDKNKILYGMMSHTVCNFLWFMPIIPLLISTQKNMKNGYMNGQGNLYWANDKICTVQFKIINF